MQHVKETLASMAFMLIRWDYCLEPCGRLGLGQSEPRPLAPFSLLSPFPATERITPGQLPWTSRGRGENPRDKPSEV